MESIARLIHSVWLSRISFCLSILRHISLPSHLPHIPSNQFLVLFLVDSIPVLTGDADKYGEVLERFGMECLARRKLGVFPAVQQVSNPRPERMET
jgi:hypothetical protein